MNSAMQSQLQERSRVKLTSFETIHSLLKALDMPDGVLRDACAMNLKDCNGHIVNYVKRRNISLPPKKDVPRFCAIIIALHNPHVLNSLACYQYTRLYRTKGTVLPSRSKRDTKRMVQIDLIRFFADVFIDDVQGTLLSKKYGSFKFRLSQLHEDARQFLLILVIHICGIQSSITDVARSIGISSPTETSFLQKAFLEPSDTTQQLGFFRYPDCEDYFFLPHAYIGENIFDNDDAVNNSAIFRETRQMIFLWLDHIVSDKKQRTIRSSERKRLYDYHRVNEEDVISSFLSYDNKEDLGVCFARAVLNSFRKHHHVIPKTSSPEREGDTIDTMGSALTAASTVMRDLLKVLMNSSLGYLFPQKDEQQIRDWASVMVTKAQSVENPTASVRKTNPSHVVRNIRDRRQCEDNCRNRLEPPLRNNHPEKSLDDFNLHLLSSAATADIAPLPKRSTALNSNQEEMLRSQDNANLGAQSLKQTSVHTETGDIDHHDVPPLSGEATRPEKGTPSSWKVSTAEVPISYRFDQAPLYGINRETDRIAQQMDVPELGTDGTISKRNISDLAVPGLAPAHPEHPISQPSQKRFKRPGKEVQAEIHEGERMTLKAAKRNIDIQHLRDSGAVLENESQWFSWIASKLRHEPFWKWDPAIDHFPSGERYPLLCHEKGNGQSISNRSIRNSFCTIWVWILLKDMVDELRDIQLKCCRSVNNLLPEIPVCTDGFLTTTAEEITIHGQNLIVECDDDTTDVHFSDVPVLVIFYQHHAYLVVVRLVQKQPSSGKVIFDCAILERMGEVQKADLLAHVQVVRVRDVSFWLDQLYSITKDPESILHPCVWDLIVIKKVCHDPYVDECMFHCSWQNSWPCTKDQKDAMEAIYSSLLRKPSTCQCPLLLRGLPRSGKTTVITKAVTAAVCSHYAPEGVRRNAENHALHTRQIRDWVLGRDGRDDSDVEDLSTGFRILILTKSENEVGLVVSMLTSANSNTSNGISMNIYWPASITTSEGLNPSHLCRSHVAVSTLHAVYEVMDDLDHCPAGRRPFAREIFDDADYVDLPTFIHCCDLLELSEVPLILVGDFMEDKEPIQLGQNTPDLALQVSPIKHIWESTPRNLKVILRKQFHTAPRINNLVSHGSFNGSCIRTEKRPFVKTWQYNKVFHSVSFIDMGKQGEQMYVDLGIEIVNRILAYDDRISQEHVLNILSSHEQKEYFQKGYSAKLSARERLKDSKSFRVVDIFELCDSRIDAPIVIFLIPTTDNPAGNDALINTYSTRAISCACEILIVLGDLTRLKEGTVFWSRASQYLTRLKRVCRSFTLPNSTRSDVDWLWEMIKRSTAGHKDPWYGTVSFDPGDR